MHKDFFKNNKRLIGHFTGKPKGPAVIIFSGIHGNEDAGVKASKKIIKRIEKDNIPVKGNLFFVYGNSKALKLKKRYIDTDLNRIWSTEHIQKLKKMVKAEMISEEREQIEIYLLIKDIIEYCSGKFYFIDLHTTSSKTFPFITISDSLNNRKFSSAFPLPTVLGIEEYLPGPLLTFMNEFGYIALGFEAGQHDDIESIKNCESFIWRSLIHTGSVKKKALNDYQNISDQLLKSRCTNKYRFFQIVFRYEIRPEENFKMLAGFENFEEIKKGQLLAENNGVEVRAVKSGRIFMPLYQNQGDDGFFIIRRVSKFWINASIVARKLHAHNFLRILPGVKKDPENKYILIVDPKTAKFMAKQIFHLFGYRQQVLKDNKLHFIKRDRKILPFP
ncbi:MAG: aspartoacylase [Flavobacteriia bacterium]|nr:MAG: aspartoacylase [Flavobacteriia bacterium]